jgi:hypothetical protein
VIAAVNVVLVLLAGYGGLHAMESPAFCGQTCHTVMKPEFVAFQGSPHARLRCVDCHVGSGAQWYVRSKFNGMHQLFAVTLGSYDKPIKTPVENMRPARDTCAHCHWPEKNWGNQLKVFNGYAYDEKNTLRQTRMLIKVGGGSSETGTMSGIHWHMNVGNEIEYIAMDANRQTIPYVRTKGRDGVLLGHRAARRRPVCRAGAARRDAARRLAPGAGENNRAGRADDDRPDL